MRRVVLLLSVLFVLSWGAAQASASLKLLVDEVTWEIAEMPSPFATFHFENMSAVDDIFAWSLGLRVIPDAGSRGTLAFASVTLPATDYVFDGLSTGLTPPISFPVKEISPIGDSSTVFPGVALPPIGSSATLLAANFSGSFDAAGVFGLYAFADQFKGSTWTDEFGMTQYFDNVPLGSGLVRIGSVIVIGRVPEPASLLILIAALTGFAWFRLWRRLVPRI